MRAVEALRQRIPAGEGEDLDYTPVHMSESDSDEEEFEMVPMIGDGQRGGGRGEGEADDGSERKRSRRGRRFTPHYTPRYSNLKMLKRKQLDASLAYGRAGPCEHLGTVP